MGSEYSLQYVFFASNQIFVSEYEYEADYANKFCLRIYQNMQI
jgi:hypothetical protein